MSDPTDMANIATTAITGLGSAGGVGLLMRMLLGKQQTEISTRLALIEQQLSHLVTAAQKHESLGERVALIERDVRAFHERLDGKRKR